MHHERLHLALEHLHACGGDHRPYVGDHAVAQDLADEAVVALETGSSRMLHGKAVVVVCKGGEERGKAA